MSYKILFIYPTDPLGSKIGGAETFIKGFIKYAPENFNIEFIGISSHKNKYQVRKWTDLQLGDKSFRFFPLFYEKDENKKSLIPLSLRFVLALKFRGIKVNNRVLFFNRIEPALIFRKAKIPKIAVIHNDITAQIFKKRNEVIWSRIPHSYLFFEKFIFKSLNSIYTVSGNTLEFYFKRYPMWRNKFNFLPTWVDTDIFFTTNKPKIGIRNKVSNLCNLPGNAKWILFVGRLQKQKSPIRVIDTFFEYYKKNNESCLIVIGEGNLKNDVIARIKKLSLENKVFLFSCMKQEELADYYNASDVLLLTSNYEGMPRCVLEALRCGLPVVTTDVGEVKRVVKNGYSGEVVGSFEPPMIAKVIAELIDNPHIYTKENCVNSVQEFIPERVLAPLYEMMRKLCAKSCIEHKETKK